MAHDPVELLRELRALIREVKCPGTCEELTPEADRETPPEPPEEGEGEPADKEEPRPPSRIFDLPWRRLVARILARFPEHAPIFEDARSKLSDLWNEINIRYHDSTLRQPEIQPAQLDVPVEIDFHSSHVPIIKIDRGFFTLPATSTPEFNEKLDRIWSDIMLHISIHDRIYVDSPTIDPEIIYKHHQELFGARCNDISQNARLHIPEIDIDDEDKCRSWPFCVAPQEYYVGVINDEAEKHYLESMASWIAHNGLDVDSD